MRVLFVHSVLFTVLTLACSALAAEVPLQRAGTLYQVEAEINGSVRRSFIVDSGASDLSLPEDALQQLIAEGSVSPNDFLADGTYQIADGSTVTQRRLRLKSVRLGSVEISDVIANIVDSKSPLLLGQSVLRRLEPWYTDGQRRVFVFQSRTSADKPGRSRNGWARLGWPDGTRYEGQVKNGLPDGEGTMSWPNGERYEGQFVANTLEGQGRRRTADGSVYTGGFHNNRMHGRGEYVLASGVRFQGVFTDGTPTGAGVLLWPDGTRYEGETRNFTPHGRGTMTWSAPPWRGDRFEGEFREGRRWGQGTYTHAGGQVRKGFWQGEKLVQATP